jgi:hypothetical protein
MASPARDPATLLGAVALASGGVTLETSPDAASYDTV